MSKNSRKCRPAVAPWHAAIISTASLVACTIFLWSSLTFLQRVEGPLQFTSPAERSRQSAVESLPLARSPSARYFVDIRMPRPLHAACSTRPPSQAPSHLIPHPHNTRHLDQVQTLHSSHIGEYNSRVLKEPILKLSTISREFEFWRTICSAAMELPPKSFTQ